MVSVVFILLDNASERRLGEDPSRAAGRAGAGGNPEARLAQTGECVVAVVSRE